ncbi:hypothetical protein K438DRAFT_2026925 [Mycena galopus ATCC 62051]|nr:hypothetical protein K438DRAFT_2026925 [Mycena galopus ATCC 62051]
MLGTLAADRARVADLDTEILLLECSLAALRSQKDQVQQRLDSYKYPVLTLPNEIISEIFVRLLPIYPQYPPFAGLDSPTLLTQICREWRQIAVATPELWRIISFDDDCDSLTFGQRLDLFRIWLTRQIAGPRPDHFPPWTLGSLDLNLSPSHISVLEGPMPLLRHLDLTLLDNNIFTISQAPSLRSITLSALSPLQVTLPLAQLTTLTLNFVHRYKYVAILQQTTSLVHCELGIAFDEDDDLVPGRGIDLPSLESLALFVDADTATTGYPDDFIAPALRSLRLVEAFLGPKPIDRLSSFIAKSDCKLQEVCVIGTTISEDSYRETFPSIHRFSFEKDFDLARIFYSQHM